MKKLYIQFSIVAGLTIAIAATNLNHSTMGDALHHNYMDTTVNPGNDFYRYAVGNWIKNNPVPASESRWGSFNEVEERNKKILLDILESAAISNDPIGSNRRRIGDFYKSGMDSEMIEKQGIEPLNPFLTEIKKMKNVDDLNALLAKWQSEGNGMLFSFSVDQDLKESSQMIPYFGQGGLSMPDRDYYINDDEKSVKLRTELENTMVSIFKLMGEVDADARPHARTVMQMETRLAKASMDRVTMRDPYASYHKMTLQAFTNDISDKTNWLVMVKHFGLPKVDSVIVGQPDFFKEVNKMITDLTIQDWKTYLRWQLIRDAAPYLSDKYTSEHFRFYSTIMRGVKTQKPRNERVMKVVEGAMGEAVGQIFVAKNFQAEAKARMLKMVKNLQDAFRDRIQKLDWMSPETKIKATEKLDKFMVKIGYPDKWKDYSTCIIKNQHFVLNVMEASKYEYNRMIAKYGRPIDKTEWGMPPQKVNAYYNPSLNEIVFPAGILQPPFFDANADDAMIYGAIGAVIGHEMTHGFDDQGCQFDAEGNLKMWWTDEDKKRFDAKTAMVVSQFDKYTLLDDVHVNGKLTLGENIADLGGLMIALEAFKRTDEGKKNLVVHGVPADQRFFLSWANAWKNNITEAALRQRIMTDPHSPGEFRTNGPVSNMDDFYKAFNITSGNMFKPEKERAKIW